MSVIFLIFIECSIVIFFWNFLRLRHFYTDKKIFYATVIAYIFQIVGMLGFILDYVNLIKTPSLNISINTNLPDLIRAISDFLYPFGGIIILFWFLPKLLDFLKDHKVSVPILQAMRGHYNNDASYRENSKQIEDLPNYKNMHDAQKQLIEIIQDELNTYPKEEHQNLLLEYGTKQKLTADCQYIYERIYGTQIQALQALKNNDELDLRSFHETHKQKIHEAHKQKITDYPNIQPDEWFKFLLGMKLIESKGNDKYALTANGDYLLEYFKKHNLFLDRIL